MAAALIALLAAPLALLAGGEGKSAIGAVLRDPMSLLEARSPGARAQGALTQTKPGHSARKGSRTAGRSAPPRERVLSNVRTRPPIGPVLVAPGEAPIFTPNTPDDALLASPGSPVGSIGGGVGAPPVAPGGTSPIGGGGSGGGGSTGGGGTVTPPVPAVPEPATWIAMILGFFAVGAALRRRRSDDRIVTAEAPIRSGG